MPIQVTCPNCSSVLSAPRKLMGRMVKCPACKARCRLPQLPPPDDAVELTLAAHSVSSAGRGWLTSILIAVPLTAAILAMAIGALLLFKSGRLPLGPFAPLNGDGETAAEAALAPAEATTSPLDALAAEALPGGAPPGIDPLAAKAQSILKQHCYRCHGQDGTAEGGFNFVLRRDKLVEGGKYIAAGKAADSFLLQRILEGEMPPDAGAAGKPSPAEIAALTEWVNAGARDFAPALERPFIDNALMVRLIREDLENKVLSRDRRYARYFTLTHLANAGFSEEELQTYRLALVKLLNSLSWNRTLAKLQPIDEAQTIFRLDLRDLEWDDKVWSLIVKANPYSVVFDTPDSKACLSITDCEVPQVRGDWFVAAASRPPLYHDVLQLPKTVKDLEKLLKVDVAQNIAKERVARCGMNASGVSQHNRLVERHDSPYGALWISYDFAASTGRKNLNQHPLGPGAGEDRFDHDGGEIIFNLPNGLQGYMLCDAKGNRLEKAPTTIVSDPKRPDRAVVNGVSCMSCHFGGIIAKADEIRRHVETNRASFPEADDILALYPKKKELDRFFTDDADRFTSAVKQLGLAQLTSTGEPVVNMAQRFEADLDLKSAAAELGLKPAEFTSKLAAVPQLARVLGVLNVAGGIVKREVFIQQFADAVTKFGLGTPVRNEAPASDAVAAGGDKPAKPAEAAGAAPAQRRTFTRIDGKQIEAEFIGLSDGLVQLKTADAKVHSVPLAEFVAVDQTFLQSKAATPADLPAGEEVAASGVSPPSAPGKRPPPVRAPYKPQRPLRLFTNTYIERGFVGELLSLKHGEVRIRRGNGVVILWPLEHLAPADQEYIAAEVGPEAYEQHKRLIQLDWQNAPADKAPPPAQGPPQYENVQRY